MAGFGAASPLGALLSVGPARAHRGGDGGAGDGVDRQAGEGDRVGQSLPVRRGPDVPLQRHLLPGRASSPTGSSGSPGSHRCGTGWTSPGSWLSPEVTTTVSPWVSIAFLVALTSWWAVLAARTFQRRLVAVTAIATHRPRGAAEHPRRPRCQARCSSATSSSTAGSGWSSSPASSSRCSICSPSASGWAQLVGDVSVGRHGRHLPAVRGARPCSPPRP